MGGKNIFASDHKVSRGTAKVCRVNVKFLGERESLVSGCKNSWEHKKVLHVDTNVLPANTKFLKGTQKLGERTKFPEGTQIFYEQTESFLRELKSFAKEHTGI